MDRQNRRSIFFDGLSLMLISLTLRSCIEGGK